MVARVFIEGDSTMRATVFEFRYRDIIIRLIYLLAVLCYTFDPVSIASLLAEGIATRSSVSAETARRGVLFSGVGLVVLAALMRTWATAYLRYDVMRNPHIMTDRLITEGPFRHVRNPLYFGNFLMVLGVSPFLSLSGMVVLVLASAVFIQRLVLREEVELERTYRGAFDDYRRTVRRWVPSLQSHGRAAAFKPSFKNGLIGELLIWIIAAALGAYAATFDLRLFGIVLICAFVPGAVRRIRRAMRRLAPARTA